MAQHTGQPYDDDLTGGKEMYNESLSTDFVDLFESIGDSDATIARLKTIIVSLDWEITDDILQQLQNELLDLKDIWAGNRINLIYVQALEKIGRYIEVERANAHPNAIKLLLAFYYNLERIVSSASISDVEKKQTLLQDVKRFEQFKAQISRPSQNAEQVSPAVTAAPVIPVQQAAPIHHAFSASSASGKKDPLVNLKAIVLGIDWEVNDYDLFHLSQEVTKLERIYSDSRVKLIFLQGIGALGGYIRATKSGAHPKAFKLLHSFCAGLDKICRGGLTSDKEKEILLVEVKKFNEFKAVIAPVSSKIIIPAQKAKPASSYDAGLAGDDEERIAPAFADMPDTVRGFRADTALAKDEIDQGVASFLGEEPAAARPVHDTTIFPTAPPQDTSEISSRLDNLFGDEHDVASVQATADKALEGVEVETEADDDSDEVALPSQGGQLAPALAEPDGGQQRSLYAEQIATIFPAAPHQDTPQDTSEISSRLDNLFGDEHDVASVQATADKALEGVEVETEADDDSNEAALPGSEHGAFAPALVFTEQKRGFREADHLHTVSDSGEALGLEDRLNSFFEEDVAATSPAVAIPEQAEPVATEGLEPAVDKIQEQVEPFTAPEEALSQEKAEELAAEPPVAVVDELLSVENIFTEVEAVPVEAAAEEIDISFNVIFEPVGDEVEVDELPVNWYEKITGQQIH